MEKELDQLKGTLQQIREFIDEENDYMFQEVESRRQEITRSFFEGLKIVRE